MECLEGKICAFQRCQHSYPLELLGRTKCTGGCYSQEKTDISSCIALPRHRNYRSNRDVLYEGFYRTPLLPPIFPTWDEAFSYLVEVRAFQHERWADRSLISLNLHVRKSGHFIPHKSFVVP